MKHSKEYQKFTSLVDNLLALFCAQSGNDNHRAGLLAYCPVRVMVTAGLGPPPVARRCGICVEALSPNHRFVIVFDSPRGDVETGLRVCPPEKKAVSLAVASSGALSLVRFEGKNRGIAAISGDF